MLDIKEGDVLVVGAKAYNIRAVHDWTMSRQSASSFARMATVSASTKRAVVADGKRGSEGTCLSNLKGTPLDPVSPEIKASIVLDQPIELMETFITDGTGYVRLFVEDKK